MGPVQHRDFNYGALQQELDRHFKGEECFTLRGKEAQQAEELLNEVYVGWVSLAWDELCTATLEPVEGGKGRTGGQPYSFVQKAVRAVLDTKQNPKAAPHRCAGWVAATIGEMLAVSDGRIPLKDQGAC